jgi:hypothetical protein
VIAESLAVFGRPNPARRPCRRREHSPGGGLDPRWRCELRPAVRHRDARTTLKASSAGITRYYRALREVILDGELCSCWAQRAVRRRAAQAAVGDELRGLPLRLFVVAGDQHVELLAVRFAFDERPGSGRSRYAVGA